MGKKQDVLEEIFYICQQRDEDVFDNYLVKEVCEDFGFGNPFDATKVDRSELYPDVMKRGQGYFIIHLGQGRHQFFPNISFGYHTLEPISDDEIIPWAYRKSLLNEYDTSESNIISVGINQRILHHFLYDDIVANPKQYGARRTKFSGHYTIDSEFIAVSRLQMEIDAVLELDNNITVIEGKNGFPRDFAVYQLFHPYLHFAELRESGELDVREIRCCYFQRLKRDAGSTLRLHLYRFHARELSSIKLVKKREYRLEIKDPL
ncbi:MAG: hypothetical protein OXG49_06865 [Chloroflexi bacterium]|nr:hypothetical protein [Chloroflexota bacterium]